MMQQNNDFDFQSNGVTDSGKGSGSAVWAVRLTGVHRGGCRRSLALVCLFGLTIAATLKAEHPDPLPVANAEAKTADQMKPYTEKIEHSFAEIEMVPIPGGTFVMGSPKDEKGRHQDEGPQHKVAISPFWMSRHEITWDAYEIWMDDLDLLMIRVRKLQPRERDKLAEDYQISQPTAPYVDMSFGLGKGQNPAICMTQLSAKVYCAWLSAKTGRYYRLPTEAEWEYAARAGSTTPYSFGDDISQLDDYAWHRGNADGKPHPVGKKKPNAWGLYDMHGNVAEWVLDQYTTDFYATNVEGVVNNPLAIPTKLYPRVVRGGSWEDEPARLRSASRVGSDEDWKIQDPQTPKSIWYHTDALGVGFRIVRPLVRPSDKEIAAKWDKSSPFQDRKAKHEIDESLRE